VAALIELLGQLPGAAELTAATLLAEVNRRATEAHTPAQGGVTLATLHKSKGLEFDAVFCVALLEGSLPSAYAKSPEQLEDERRLFYVGITRARTHLFVSWAKERPGPKGQIWKGRPSQFLDDLAPPKRTESSWVTKRRAATGRIGVSSGPSPSTCAQCGADLKGMPARRLGRCGLACLTGDDARMAEVLSAWREEVAPALGLEATDLASDRALFSIISSPPGTHFELQSVAGLYQAGIASFGPDLVERVRRVTASALPR
jgi:DNA helicase-2/ATP-dependent DNA helicase PcrA